jgi:hypothetical protein
MLAGLDGKLIEYDAENRPVCVTLAGSKTPFTSTARAAPG